MAGQLNAIGMKGLLKVNYTKNKLIGEKMMGFEFDMAVKGYPLWSVLVRAAQTPTMGRTLIEDFGPNALKFQQYGPLENSGEITVTVVESIAGVVIQDLRNIIANKEYVDITLRATPESMGGVSGRGHEFELMDCMLRCDPIELSTEDQSLVKVAITIIYNYFDI